MNIIVYFSGLCSFVAWGLRCSVAQSRVGLCRVFFFLGGVVGGELTRQYMSQYD